MEFCLQFGNGMMEHSKVLLEAWGGGTLILSPRDLDAERMASFAAEIKSISNTTIIVDPQFFYPDATYSRLISHDYWPADFDEQTFWASAAHRKMIVELRDLNRSSRASRFVLPGVLCTSMGTSWLRSISSSIEIALDIGVKLPLVATLALNPEILRSDTDIGEIIDKAQSWDIHGFYIVCESPNGDYLVQDPLWISGLLDLVAGLKLGGFDVIVGYATHQMLICSTAKIDAIASGTWMNVRTLYKGKFFESDDVKRKTDWYYCPSSLSEYRLPVMDLANRRGILNDMRPSVELDGGYCDQLFSGVQPTTSGFNQRSAFRHFLHSMKRQSEALDAPTFEEALEKYNTLLISSEDLNRRLRTERVFGQHKDFHECFEICRASIGQFEDTRGVMMEREWNNI